MSVNPESVNPSPESPDPFSTSDQPLARLGAMVGESQEQAGAMIGPYKLLQLIGMGGMGAVWMAEQREPVQRRVAIKIIKSDLGGARILARFEAERQALAMMDHPNIAKVLDAGSTGGHSRTAPEGQPYFVMELVKGIPFTQYCDQENLSLQERLELFIPICNAVHHAHQKGIIHRDLKPSNVLVALYDGKPIPKVIDFGVAKALTQKLTERTMVTEIGQLVGTLEYMAPEQAELNNLDIDTRADIYSLGIMLYELLTGAPPFAVRRLPGVAFVEVLRMIREVEPARPSSQLAGATDVLGIASRRKLEPKKLARLVRGDLDWIVMKCLEKERGRRYETANQLGQDLQRFLADEPVQAGPPSIRYRAGKFFRRNKGPVAATALVLLLLVAAIGTIAYTWLSTRAAGHVEGLLSANIEEVLPKTRELGPVLRFWADPLLRTAKAKAMAEQDASRRLRAGIALLPTDTAEIEYLYSRLLDAEPSELLVIREALNGHKAELVEPLWKVVESSNKPSESQRLRAAATLALYDPASTRWDRARTPLAADLVSVNPVFLGAWSKAFQPIKSRLVPSLVELCREPRTARTSRRLVATNLLVDYAADQPTVLADLLMNADAPSFGVVFDSPAIQGGAAVPFLNAELSRTLLPEAAPDDQENLARRQANAAIALLRLGRPADVWRLMKHRADPLLRSQLIHRLGPLGVDVGALLKRLKEEPDPTVRAALLLSLGPEEFRADAWTPETKKLALQEAEVSYRAAEPGLHAAAEWLLRKWDQKAWLDDLNAAWAKDVPERQRRLDLALHQAAPSWYVNSEVQTLVVIPSPPSFTMGSPRFHDPAMARWFADEKSHQRKIGRTYAIATKPVTVAEYGRFKEHKFTKRFARYPDSPVISTSWHQAAAYCNWLTLREMSADQCCYEIAKNGDATLKEKHLSLQGYRLPTEAEWEYACRAGASTLFYFGDGHDLVGQYATLLKNSGEETSQVGAKKPNDFGLFDMHGNVWCWCQDQYQKYPEGPADQIFNDQQTVREVSAERILRGGAFLSPPEYARCASRVSIEPTTRNYSIGFRIARTIR